MPIRLEFTFKFEDYVDALRLHAKRSLRWRTNWILSQKVFPILGALMILVALWLVQRSRYPIFRPHGPWFTFLLVLSAGTYFALYPFHFRRRLERNFKLTNNGNSYTMEFDEKQICIRRSDTMSEIPWSEIESSAENDRLFMLYLTPVNYLPIPKHACAGNQIDWLRDLLGEKLPASTK